MASIKTISGGATHGDGVLIGQTGEKVALFGFTPVVQPVGATQAAVTDTVGAALGAFTDPPSAGEMAALRTFVNALRVDSLAQTVLVNKLRTDAIALGIIKGAA